jgi:hypothetical protein
VRENIVCGRNAREPKDRAQRNTNVRGEVAQDAQKEIPGKEKYNDEDEASAGRAHRMIGQSEWDQEQK